MAVVTLQELAEKLSEHLGMKVELALNEFDDSAFSFDNVRYELRVTNALLTTDCSNGDEIFGSISMGPGTAAYALENVWSNLQKQLSECETINVFDLDTCALTNHHPYPAELDLGKQGDFLPPSTSFEQPKGWAPDKPEF